MTNIPDPTKPLPDSEKFKPKNVAGAGADRGRADAGMHDVARGSEGDRRRASQNRANGRNS